MGTSPNSVIRYSTALPLDNGDGAFDLIAALPHPELGRRLVTSPGLQGCNYE
jgi:hypothetical protein